MGLFDTRLLHCLLPLLLMPFFCGCRPANRGDLPEKAAARQQDDQIGTRASRLLNAVDAHLARGEWQQSDPLLTELAKLEASLSKAQREHLELARQRWHRLKNRTQSGGREALLQEAAQALSAGDLERAAAALTALTEGTPDPALLPQMERLQSRLQAAQADAGQLQAAVAQLAHDDPQRAQAARQIVWQHPEQSLPLIAQLLTQDDPQRFRAALEIMVRMNRPRQTLPHLVNVLAQPQWSDRWPDVLTQLSEVRQQGAGPALLELYRTATAAEVRAVALAGLARVVDPPRDTLTAILPALYESGPELPAALQAAAATVVRHNQRDLETLRGFDDSLSEEDRTRLRRLLVRVEQLQSAEAASLPPGTGRAARMLLAALGQELPAPVQEIRVLAASDRESLNNAAALFDGKWTKAEATAWRARNSRRPWILLDLGRERVISGLRIYNCNISGGTNLGWREVEIALGNSASTPHIDLVAPLPQASDKEDAGDFSVLIALPMLRGRYLRLQATQLWTSKDEAALSELQVLAVEE